MAARRFSSCLMEAAWWAAFSLASSPSGASLSWSSRMAGRHWVVLINSPSWLVLGCDVDCGDQVPGNPIKPRLGGNEKGQDSPPEGVGQGFGLVAGHELQAGRALLTQSREERSVGGSERPLAAQITRPVKWLHTSTSKA